MVTNCDTTGLPCFVRNVSMVKQWFDRASAFHLEKVNFTVLYANCLMNLMIKKDFRGMGSLIGRMHLEAYLRKNYLQSIKMLLLYIIDRV